MARRGNDCKPTMKGARLKRLGTIYVLRNAAFRDSLIKIGKTARSVDVRAQELSRGTGVPGPFEVLYHEDVSDVDEAERLIHRRLADCRLSNNREFFLLPLPSAVRVVFEVCMQVDDANRTARAILLWMNGQCDSSRLKEALARYVGGETAVVLHYRNSQGECHIRLPDDCRIKWDPKILDDLGRIPGIGEIIVATSDGKPLGRR